MLSLHNLDGYILKHIQAWFIDLCHYKFALAHSQENDFLVSLQYFFKDVSWKKIKHLGALFAVFNQLMITFIAVFQD